MLGGNRPVGHAQATGVCSSGGVWVKMDGGQPRLTRHSRGAGTYDPGLVSAPVAMISGPPNRSCGGTRYVSLSITTTATT